MQQEIPLPDGSVMTAPSHAETFARLPSSASRSSSTRSSATDEWATREGVERVAARLNEAAAEAAEHGMRVGYHNHDHELRPQIDGKPALQVLAELLDRGSCSNSTCTGRRPPGIDLVPFIQELGDRIVAVHVKDGPMHDGISTASIPTDQTPAGQGDVRLAEAIAAAPSLEYAVIEFDGFDGEIFDGVEQSYRWLDATREQGGGLRMTRTGKVGVGLIGAGMISEQYLTNLTRFPTSRSSASATSTPTPCGSIGGEVGRRRVRHRRRTSSRTRTSRSSSTSRSGQPTSRSRRAPPSAPASTSGARSRSGRPRVRGRLVASRSSRSGWGSASRRHRPRLRWQTAKRAIEAGAIGTRPSPP